MEQERIVNAITDAGYFLLAAGAEIYRVEDTVERMARSAGFANADVYATPTGLFAAFTSGSGSVYSRVRRIRMVRADLTKIAAINDISRQFVQDPDSKRLQTQLNTLPTRANYPPGLRLLAGALGSAAFAIVFGGAWIDMLPAAVAGGTAMLVTLLPIQIPRFLMETLAAALAAATAILGAAILSTGHDLVILSGVMVLVPGVSMTTSVRDLLSGELVSGTARAAEAAVTAVAVAVGVAAALSVLGGVL